MIKELPCSRGGLDIFGQAFIPAGGKRRKPVVVFSHGLNGNYGNFSSYHDMLAELDVAGYTFDFCGGSTYSRSCGDMRDMSVLTEAADLGAVLDYVKTLDFVDAGNVFLAGESQGGLVSALVASKRPADIRGLILMAPAFVIPDHAARTPESGPMAAMFSPKYKEDARSVRLYGDVQGYTGDVLIVHGDSDDVAPLCYSKEAADAYASAKLVVVNGAGHKFSAVQNEILIAEMSTFLKTHISINIFG